MSRLLTLGWPQFIALAGGLMTVVVALALIVERDISESLSRLEVRQHQRTLGFEMGRVKGFPYEPPDGTWGIVHVTPGGTMDRAGMRRGDIVVSYHGYAFTELRAAIRDAASGRTACVLVQNAAEARTGAGREICWRQPTKTSGRDTN